MICTKIDIFPKILNKQKIFDFLIKIDIFQWFGLKLSFFENFHWSRDFQKLFENLYKIDIFRILWLV